MILETPAAENGTHASDVLKARAHPDTRPMSCVPTVHALQNYAPTGWAFFSGA